MTDQEKIERLEAKCAHYKKALEIIAPMPCILALIGETSTDEYGNPTECGCAGCVARKVLSTQGGDGK